MQNNELFEGRGKEKRETGDQAQLGEYSRGWFGEVAQEWGVRDGVASGHYGLTWAQRQGCKQNCDHEPEPGK